MPLGAGIVGRSVRVRTDGADVDKIVDALVRTGLGEGARALDVEGVESLLTGLGEHGHEVDHGVGALDGARDRVGVAEVGLDELHLADIADDLEVEAEMRAAHGHAHAPAVVDELADHVLADEAGAAEHYGQFRGERVLSEGVGHGGALSPSRARLPAEPPRFRVS